MKPIKIIGHIMVATGKTVPEWAETIGFSKAAVYFAINRTYKSPKIRAEICGTTGLPENALWPELTERKARGK